MRTCNLPFVLFGITVLMLGLVSPGWGEVAQASSLRNTGKMPVPQQGMVLVPEGWFVMGSNHWDEDESPEQKVYLKAFYIDRYEVTHAQYRLFEPDHSFSAGEENHPVTMVSWRQAFAYARWAGKRLPLEAEWEKAARGADGRTYPWGEGYVQGICNTYQTNRWATAPVGFFSGDVSPFGVVDLVGNVMEWTASFYHPYPGNDNNEREDYQKGFRVIRGSSWDGDFYCYGRASYRNFAPPEGRYPSVGFRCAKDY